MTTTPTPNQDRMTAAEIRAAFDNLTTLMDSMRSDIETLTTAIATMATGLQHAASAATPASGQTTTFLAEAIARGVSEKTGKDTYKLRGGPYRQNGITIWPEVMSSLDIDIDSLAYGVTQLTEPINVLVQMHDYTDPKTHETRVTPYKVIGKA